MFVFFILLFLCGDLFSFVFFLLLLLLVSFLTLLERNILSHVQERMGPMKVSLLGLLQAIMDAMKLLKKNYGFLSNSFYFISCSFAMTISVMQWFFLPFNFLYYINMSILIFLLLSSILVFPNLAIGWFSSNFYSMLGSLRGIVLMVSYEAVFAFFFLLIMIESGQYGFLSFYSSYFNLFLILCMLILFLAELNRIPFDLSEAESELVSSYNTEYSGSPFTFLFLAEYISILFFCCMFSIFLFKSLILGIFMFCFFCFLRSMLPRVKYFNVIVLMWMFLLPISIIFLVFYFLPF